MPIVKVNRNFQVTIPASVRRQLDISKGDYLEAIATRDGILYRVKDLVDRDISEYWEQRAQEEGESELSRSGERKLREALLEGEQGEVEEFDNIEDLIEDLNH